MPGKGGKAPKGALTPGNKRRPGGLQPRREGAKKKAEGAQRPVWKKHGTEGTFIGRGGVGKFNGGVKNLLGDSHGAGDTLHKNLITFGNVNGS